MDHRRRPGGLLPDVAVHADRAVRRAAVRRLPRRPHLRLVARRPRRRGDPGPGPARPRDRRGADRLGGRPTPGRRDGRARPRPLARPGTPTPPGSAGCSASSTSSRPAAVPGRWRRPTSAASSPARPATPWPRPSASLAGVPSFRPSVDQWAAKAMSVVDGLVGARHAGGPDLVLRPRAAELFATAIAKYFRNAIREAILLQICDAGIVFLPGAGGTVQEIFQDACENYYAAPESRSRRWCWSARRTGPRPCPAWPLLRALARGRAMEAPRPPGRHRRRCGRAGHRQLTVMPRHVVRSGTASPWMGEGLPVWSGAV